MKKRDIEEITIWTGETNTNTNFFIFYQTHLSTLGHFFFIVIYRLSRGGKGNIRTYEDIHLKYATG